MAVFPGANISDCFDVTELNKKKLNSTSNICINQACIQRFDCEYITFKADINMFERMEIAKFICKGVVESSHKKFPRAYDNRSGHGRKMRGESAS